MATTQEVAKLYIAFFNRAPDKGGLEFWTNSGMSAEALATEWLSGNYPEVTAKYPAGQDAATFINTIYMNVLGRPAEAGGLTFWVNALNSGGVTRDTAIVEIVKAAQGTDGVRLENLADVGLYWAENNNASSPDYFKALESVTAESGSVENAKHLIMTGTPVKPVEETGKTVVFVDDKVYTEVGTAKDDNFIVEIFKDKSSVDGKEGSDTLDFSQYYKDVGVTVNLAAGTAVENTTATSGIAAATPKMAVQWVENVVGTANDDVLTGDRNNNIIRLEGGEDVVNAGIGDDIIVAADMANVLASTINGGTGVDILRVLDSAINLTNTSMITSIEVLDVGYAKGDNGKPAAATITVAGTEAPGEGLTKFKKIMANSTPAKDRSNKELDDTILSTGNNLDLTGVELVGFEIVKVTTDGGTITIGADTFATVKQVIGKTDTKLALVGKDDDVFDLQVPKFTEIAQLLAPVDAAGNEIKATIIVNQSLVDTLDFVGDFSNVTLQLSGRAIDATDLGLSGFTAAPKAIVYGDAVDLKLTVAQAEALAAAGTEIIGSEGLFDSLTIEATVAGTPEDVDLTDLVLVAVEELILNEIENATLTDEVLTDVNNIAGDGSTETYLLNGNVAPALPVGAPIPPLDLTDTKLRDITGLGDSAAPTQEFLFDLGTMFGPIAAQNGAGVSSTPLSEIWGTVILDEAGSYDFSGIKDGEGPNGDGPLIVGSDGDDFITGSKTFKMEIDGGKGHDTIIGGDAVDTLNGGEGNDTINGGKGVDEITGGKGQDIMTGGADGDNFYFETGDTLATLTGVDIITDFKVGDTATVTDADILNFTLVTNSTNLAAAQAADATGNIFNYEALFASEASLSAAAMAALEEAYEDSGIGATDASKALVAQFTYGGKSYVAVDVLANLDKGTGTVEKSLTIDFVVKLDGVTDDLDVKNLAFDGVEAPAA
ncbi:DUF4214 domain-containing protein [Thiothrix winogradskyi]|uniref:DUF4214 domain-containing protein n=1 Tax=Thiothrix winogradskyi TaxID=96472 RepID=A0ABY3T0I4_9GAMM|nr:DUF4214 domain-containing protein [Thiothrix winogradskyi]UJS24339.1 DUF4214 domain-containing protein [Thiothrix winogradskyi]